MSVELQLGLFEDAQLGRTTRTSTIGEVAAASIESGWKAAETSSLIKATETFFAERKDDITDHKELNRKFPEIEVPFTEPTSLAKAEVIARHARERRELRNIIAHGQDTFTNDVIGFAGSMVGSMIDPIGIASGAALHFGLGKVMGKTLLQQIGKSTGKTILKEAGEGALGNLITEAAIVIPASIQDREDINAYNNVRNAIVGGMAFPAALAAIKGGMRGAYAKMKNYDHYQMGRMMAMTEAKLEAGKNPEMSPRDMDLIENGAEAVDRIENPEAVRAEANSPTRDMYHDPEIQKAVDTIDETPEIAAVDRANERLDDVITNVAEEPLTDAEVGQFKEIKDTMARDMEDADEAIKMFTVCERRSA